MANVKGTTEVVKTVAAKKVEEAKEAVKSVAKAVEAKAEEVKAEAKAAEKAEEKVEKAAEHEKKAEAPAKEVKETKEAKTAKKPGRKPAKEAKAAKKAAAEPKVYVQFGADESSVEAIVEKIKSDYVEQGHRVSSIKDLRVYLKPEDDAAYYVINEKVAGRVDLF